MKRRHALLAPLAATAAAASPAPAADWSNPFARGLRDSFRLHWVDTKDYTLAMLEAMPADSFEFKAHPSQRGFGDQLLHLCWANLIYFRAFGASDTFPKTYADVVKTYPPADKAAVRRFVAETFDHTLAVLDGLAEKDVARTDLKLWAKAPAHSTTDVFFRAYMHTAHHRGQIVTYLRVKGLTPPTWKFEPHA
ncbi:MAG: DinB family protein [Bryobacterales bacterium]|nr:DinB family protein [Bryobacterales bacterium]